MNSGGIRSDINVGPITYGEAFSVQPFANVLVTMDMTGAQIDALLEQQFTGGNGVLQIPASLTYDRSTACLGGRPDLQHPDRWRRSIRRPPTGSRSTTSSPTAVTTTPSSRRGRTASWARSTSTRSARYIEFLGTVNPGPQNRITLRRDDQAGGVQRRRLRHRDHPPGAGPSRSVGRGAHGGELSTAGLSTWRTW